MCRAVAVTAGALAIVACSVDARAQSCEPSGGRNVIVTAVVGAGVGIGAALGTSAILALADHTRNFHFAVGAGVGGGVTLGLSGLYGVVDYYSGCHMVNNAGGFAWSVPIVTFIVGAALPIAIWGASEKKTGETSAALSLPSLGYSGTF